MTSTPASPASRSRTIDHASRTPTTTLGTIHAQAASSSSPGPDQQEARDQADEREDEQGERPQPGR